ncbi:hypothetical protein O0L34_g1934 [Tuta absoluta]|nr:hypothetical protein O0L34_g1934 [Tuta absoluta]
MNTNMKCIKAMDFTLETTLRFIEMISDQPALYNPKDMSFTDKILKVTIWQGIAEHFGRSVPDCKKAWRYLRDSFSRSQNQLKGNTTIKLNNYHSNNYKLFKKLSFLDGIVPAKTKKSKRNKEPAFKTSANPIVVGIEHVMFEKPKTLGPELNASKPKAIFSVAQTADDAPKSNDNSSPSESDTPEPPELDISKKTINVKKVLRKVDPSKVPLAIKQRHHIEQSSSSNISKPTEIPEDTTIPLFVEHAKEVLKRLPPLLKIQAKVEMFRVLTKYQMLALNDSNISTNVPIEIPVHMTNGSTSLQDDEPIEISIEESKVVKTEPNEMAIDKNTSVQVKAENNVYDDVIELKEEEMILT